MSRLGKNKKKRWRTLLPEANDLIEKANTLKAIKEVDFHIIGKTETEKPKYVTSTRVVIKRKKIKRRSTIGDFWDNEASVKPVSKNQRKILAGMSKKPQENQLNHPGLSYIPNPSDHTELLNKLAEDESKKIREIEKVERQLMFKEDDAIENVEGVEEEIELTTHESILSKVLEKTKQKLTKRKRQKKAAERKLKMAQMAEIRKQKLEAHLLRNIPKISKELRQDENNQLKRRVERKERELKQAKEKEMSEQLLNVPVILPSDVPTCLRRLKPQGDWVGDALYKLRPHKFKSDKPKKRQRRVKKMVQKKCLVK